MQNTRKQKATTLPESTKRRLEVYVLLQQAMELLMEDQKEPWHDLKCSQCGGSFFLFGAWQEIRHPLCLKCWDLYQERLWKMQEQNIRGINFELSTMEDTTGIPRGTFTRYQTAPPRQTTILGDLVLNNIKIDNSAIGVLNTGSINGSLQNIDATLSLLKNAVDTQPLETAIKKFTEAVLTSTELTNEQKSNLLELMSAIADEMRHPKEKRRTSVATSILQGIKNLTDTTMSLAQLWQTLGPMLTGMFS